MAEKTLLVFAHADEASAFGDVSHLVTGVGKINAAVSLSAALAAGAGSSEPSEPVERVVVLGTAGVVGEGSHRLDLDTVYQVTRVLQHDFSLPSPPIDLEGETILPPAQHTAMATGDQFVKSDEDRERIASLGAALVDMEGYAYASVCARAGVPLQIFKVPSDFADSTTTDAEWDEIVFRKSEQLRDFWATQLP